METTTYHHGALRQALVSAALELLDEGAKVSLRGAARRAGVSHAAPYHHFEDRRALIAAVAEHGIARLRDDVRAAAVRHGSEPGRALIEVGVAYVRFAAENPALFRLIFSAELSDRTDLPGLEAAYEQVWREAKALSGRVLQDGASEEEVGFRALRGWSMVHGLANLILDRQVPGTSTSEDAERMARRMLLSGAPTP